MSTPERKRVGVLTRLSRAFALQIAIISVATIGGVIATARVIEDVLTRQALNGEAEHYWSLFDANPREPLPNTNNMRGYLAVNGNFDAVPPTLRAEQPGYRRVKLDEHKPILHVSDHGPARLYLVFAEAQVSDLAFYFGVAPLTVVLLLLYVLAWFTYRMSQRAVSPMVQLADRLESSKWSFEKGVRLPLADLRPEADAEVAVMIDALEAFTERLNSFVERERNFTRDASHELRTPIAVLNGSLDLLARDTNRPEAERATLARMRRTVTDMRSLIDTLLLLAREDEIAAPREPVIVNEVVRAEVAEQRDFAAAAKNDITIVEEEVLELRAPAKVIAILLGNLLRNALSYTKDGRVEVTVTATGVRVADSGIGMTPQEVERAFEPFYRAERAVDGTSVSGHGLGLAIVHRLATQFGWKVRVASTAGVGTTVDVEFV
jgi:signal transduction histidine kinase